MLAEDAILIAVVEADFLYRFVELLTVQVCLNVLGHVRNRLGKYVPHHEVKSRRGCCTAWPNEGFHVAERFIVTPLLV